MAGPENPGNEPEKTVLFTAKVQTYGPERYLLVDMGTGAPWQMNRQDSWQLATADETNAAIRVLQTWLLRDER